MNDDDLLFGDAAIKDLKDSRKSEDWLAQRKAAMLARFCAQKASLEKFLASAPPSMVARFDKPI